MLLATRCGVCLAPRPKVSREAVQGVLVCRECFLRWRRCSAQRKPSLWRVYEAAMSEVARIEGTGERRGGS